MVSSVYKKSLHVHSKPLRTVPVESDCCFQGHREAKGGLGMGLAVETSVKVLKHYFLLHLVYELSSPQENISVKSKDLDNLVYLGPKTACVKQVFVT